MASKSTSSVSCDVGHDLDEPRELDAQLVPVSDGVNVLCTPGGLVGLPPVALAIGSSWKGTP